MNADNFNPKRMLLELERTHTHCNCGECQLLPPVFLSGQQIRLRDARNAARREWDDLTRRILELEERQKRVGIAFDLLDREFQKIPRYQTGMIKKAAMPTAGRHFERLVQKVAQAQAVFDEECFIRRFGEIRRTKLSVAPLPTLRRPAPPS
jgi:hypothetical protein